MNHDTPGSGGRPRNAGFNVALALLLVIAAFFLLAEHRAHLGNILVWGLLLACPLLHVFMHRDHGGGHHDHDAGGDERSRSSSAPRER